MTDFPARARWNRHVSNPVLPPTQGWEGAATQEPSVLIEDGLWKMWYRGGWAVEAIGYATSFDGVTWTPYASNPVLGQGGSGIGGNAAQPEVVKHNGTYYLYYTEFLESGDMVAATSPDGIAWTVALDPAITKPATVSQWGNRSAWVEGSAWKMLLEGSNLLGVWEIYLATSTDGISWTLASGPLSSLQVATGGMYGGPNVHRLEGVYHVWYHAANVAGVLPTDIYHATSDDLLNWTRTGIVLEHLGSGFEFDQVADPQVVFAPNGDAHLYYDGDDNVPPEGASIGLAIANGPGTGSIEAWVTTLAGTYLTHLDRSAASPFRRFTVQSAINSPGVGSLEYHLDNALVAGHDDLFAYSNLVWFRYRGKTRVWIIEERVTVLDKSESSGDWIKVAGRGVLQLIGDRTIWPTHYSDVNNDPTQWQLGGWETKTDASAAAGQKVVPVVSTTAGDGATVGDPVEIVGGGNRQIGIIASIVAGVSVTLEDDLAYTFPIGSRVRSAARQWRRFVNRRAGEMLWDNISESASRFVAPLVRGTVETTGADGWTQDFRFDNQLDVLTSVTNVYGDVEMDGLTFNYYNCLGADRRASVIFEEGADVTSLDVSDNDRDSLSWVVAEGTGHAVFSYLAPVEKTTRSQRKTAKRSRTERRKAPAAPRKVIEVRADYTVDLASEAVGITRRREAFLDAKDVSDPVQLDALADAALEEHQITEAVGLEVIDSRFQLDADYGLGDWVRTLVPSRGFNEDVRIVAVAIVEDDSERVRVGIAVNTARTDHILKLAAGAKDTRSSLGVQNRQPMGNPLLVPISDTVYFDTTTDSVTSLWVPDRVDRVWEARLAIDFDQYPMPVSAAASGGGATSGSATPTSAGSSTSDASDDHNHDLGVYESDTPGAYTKRRFSTPGESFNLETSTAGDMSTYGENALHHHGIPGHGHGAHDHAVPAHGHSLTAAATKEAYPASHSVVIKVYELVDTTWTLRGTLTAITVDRDDSIDLLPYLPHSGQWRITCQSSAAQPNGGRIAAHLSGYVLGASQSA